jgi:hypothetical protein
MIHNPHPTRLIYLNQKILEEEARGQAARKARETSFSRSRRISFPTKKKNGY